MMTLDIDIAWCYPCGRGGPRAQIRQPCPSCGALMGVSEAEFEHRAVESRRNVEAFMRRRHAARLAEEESVRRRRVGFLVTVVLAVLLGLGLCWSWLAPW